MLATKPWGDKTRRYFLTRPEEYREGLKAALGIWCAALEHVTSLACQPMLSGPFMPHQRTHVFHCHCINPLPVQGCDAGGEPQLC